MHTIATADPFQLLALGFSLGVSAAAVVAALAFRVVRNR